MIKPKNNHFVLLHPKNKELTDELKFRFRYLMRKEYFGENRIHGVKFDWDKNDDGSLVEYCPHEIDKNFIEFANDDYRFNLKDKETGEEVGFLKRIKHDNFEVWINEEFLDFISDHVEFNNE